MAVVSNAEIESFNGSSQRSRMIRRRYCSDVEQHLEAGSVEGLDFSTALDGCAGQWTFDGREVSQ
jgi:hypothetical protein